MRRHTAATLILALALTLTACGPTREQQDCEATGGTWTRERTGTTVVWSGKTPVMVPRYTHHCTPPTEG